MGPQLSSQALLGEDMAANSKSLIESWKDLEECEEFAEMNIAVRHRDSFAVSPTASSNLVGGLTEKFYTLKPLFEKARTSRDGSDVMVARSLRTTLKSIRAQVSGSSSRPALQKSFSTLSLSSGGADESSGADEKALWNVLAGRAATPAWRTSRQTSPGSEKSDTRTASKTSNTEALSGHKGD